MSFIPRGQKRLARASKQFTVARLREADEILLEHIARGKYFRLLADVIVDGDSLGLALVKAGHARAYDGGAKGENWCGGT
nr:thermonuclease family protein [uncultured Halomonas sp.]